MPPELGQCPDCQQWILLPCTEAPAPLCCPWCQCPLDVDSVRRVPVRTAEHQDENVTDPDERLAPPATQDRTTKNAAQTDDDPTTLSMRVQPDHVANGVAPHDAGDRESLPVVVTHPAGKAEEVPSPFQSQAPLVQQRQQQQRRKRPAWEGFKIVAGGAAGLAIAQLMLWWMPGFGHRDPFGVARHLPAWLDFVAPPELRPRSAPRPSPFTQSSTGTTTQSSTTAIANPALWEDTQWQPNTASPSSSPNDVSDASPTLADTATESSRSPSLPEPSHAPTYSGA